jgi:multiple sugar transport system permease protein
MHELASAVAPGLMPGATVTRSRLPRFIVHRKRWGLAFVAPAVLFFAVFSIFPVLLGSYLSLTDYDLLSPPRYAGLANYTALLGDRLFLKAVRNTLIFVLGSTVPVWIASLLLALLFEASFRGRDLVKALLFSPVLLPPVVVAVVWKVLLHPSGVMTNLVGPLIGHGEIRWLTDISLSPYAVILVNNWTVIPFFMVIWLAGLSGIPVDVKEAAKLDGATAFQAFVHVVLPLLKPTGVLIAALSTINAFQTFILQYVMTPDRGGPADANVTIGLLIWKYGFLYYRMGAAAAVSVVLFAVILLVTVLQLWLGREK